MCARLVVAQSGEAGPADAVPLVLIHGIATDRHIWDLVSPQLARSRRVVTLDVPGFGESDAVDEDFALARVADRIARGLAGRRLRGPFDVVGHSLGGGVALALAAARPRLVRRLILVAPAGLRPLAPAVSRFLAVSANAALAARRRAAGLTDVAWGRRLLLALTAADGADVPPMLARSLIEASVSARSTEPALATITSADLRPLLSKVRAPLGVIWGEADRTIPIRILQDLVDARPDALIRRIPDAGHVPMVECADLFTAQLEELLQQLPRERGRP